MATLKDLSELSKNDAVKAVPASDANVEVAAEERKAQIDKQGRAYGTGRRKNSTARVYIKPGTGKIVVNKKDVKEYFARPVLQMIINQPFEAVGSSNRFDVEVNVTGGGLSGQAGAVLHGISRALDNYDPANHIALRQGGFLTRDSRAVERKKPGQPKARKKFQFSKR